MEGRVNVGGSEGYDISGLNLLTAHSPMPFFGILGSTQHDSDQSRSTANYGTIFRI